MVIYDQIPHLFPCSEWRGSKRANQLCSLLSHSFRSRDSEIHAIPHPCHCIASISHSLIHTHIYQCEKCTEFYTEYLGWITLSPESRGEFCGDTSRQKSASEESCINSSFLRLIRSGYLRTNRQVYLIAVLSFQISPRLLIRAQLIAKRNSRCGGNEQHYEYDSRKPFKFHEKSWPSAIKLLSCRIPRSETKVLSSRDPEKFCRCSTCIFKGWH